MNNILSLSVSIALIFLMQKLSADCVKDKEDVRVLHTLIDKNSMWAKDKHI